mgnify:CR=1 FL=1
MNAGLLIGAFLVGLGLFLFRLGKVGGVVPFTREERPLLFFFTIALAIVGGTYKIAAAIFN